LTQLQHGLEGSGSICRSHRTLSPVSGRDNRTSPRVCRAFRTRSRRPGPTSTITAAAPVSGQSADASRSAGNPAPWTPGRKPTTPPTGFSTPAAQAAGDHTSHQARGATNPNRKEKDVDQDRFPGPHSSPGRPRCLFDPQFHGDSGFQR
jgi:hypothetical protein